uniref:Reverse transcriptase domain-containing protein n=1 Tax=Tanacetum cinerariifolium TaxID=118510 RepID=A0A6L2MKI2_TANCI|nr:hypothetical protein [Tanacetum cinerariifolium]
MRKKKNKKLKELKARLNFEGCSGTSRYSESKTMSTMEHDKRYRYSRSRSPRTSVFSRIRRERARSPIRRERSRSPRQMAKERGMFKRLGNAQTAIASTLIQGTWKHSQRAKIVEVGIGSQDQKKKKSSGEEDDLSQPWVCEETDSCTPRIRYFDFPKTRMPSHIKTCVKVKI